MAKIVRIQDFISQFSIQSQESMYNRVFILYFVDNERFESIEIFNWVLCVCVLL